MKQSADGDGQLHTLGLLERLRAECKTLWGTSSELYFRVDGLLRELANPNLHDIPTNLPFRVEMWDRHHQHIRWVISASSSVSIAHAALDVAITNYPTEHFTLRNRALVIREHKPLGNLRRRRAIYIRSNIARNSNTMRWNLAMYGEMDVRSARKLASRPLALLGQTVTLQISR